jgi:hypothetical protein
VSPFDERARIHLAAADAEVDRAPDVLLIVSCLGRGTGIDAIQQIPGDTPFQGQDAPMVGPILLSCVGR